MRQNKARKEQRVSSRPGSMGCRARVGLGDMPEEILLLILSFLRPPFLRPLRLVCRSFRQVTVEHMTGLRLVNGNRSSVSDALRVFPNISALTIPARVSASSRKWPESVSLLKSLVIHRSAMDKALRLPGLLRCLSGLTSLTFLTTRPCPKFKLGGMHDIVAWCPALQTLELEQGFLTWDPANYALSILQLTALRELKLYCIPIVWSSLLPRLTSLTLLRTLTCVCVEAWQDVTALAALTQLTSLGAMLRLSEWANCLRSLTGLARIALQFSCNEEENGPPGPLLRQLPMSLEGLSLRNAHWGASANDWRLISGMTRLDSLQIGFANPETGVGYGFWSLRASNPWCEHLVSLRRLALVGQPIGAPNLRVLVQHLTALEHLRLRLKLFDDVHHLSALTRLTLLNLYKESRGAPSPRHMGPPRFLTALQHMRHLSLYWGIRPGEERETVRCLGTLVELERLHVTLVPLERGPASRRLSRDVGADAPRGPAGEAYRRQHGVKKFLVSKPHNVDRKLGIQVLKPLARLVLLQEIQVEGGYMVDRQTWDRIQKLREGLGLPVVTPISLLTEDCFAITLA